MNDGFWRRRTVPPVLLTLMSMLPATAIAQSDFSFKSIQIGNLDISIGGAPPFTVNASLSVIHAQSGQMLLLSSLGTCYNNNQLEKVGIVYVVPGTNSASASYDGVSSQESPEFKGPGTASYQSSAAVNGEVYELTGTFTQKEFRSAGIADGDNLTVTKEHAQIRISGSVCQVLLYERREEWTVAPRDKPAPTRQYVTLLHSRSETTCALVK